MLKRKERREKKRQEAAGGFLGIFSDGMRLKVASDVRMYGYIRRNISAASEYKWEGIKK